MHSTAALPECLCLVGLLISPILGDYGADTQRRMCHITLSAWIAHVELEKLRQSLIVRLPTAL